MKDFSLIEKFEILMNLISESPLFFVCSILAILLLIFLIVLIVLNKKINKWIFLSIWAVILLILMINYSKVIFDLIDNLFNNIFMALYFPNLTIYIVILSISNFFLILSIFKKSLRKSVKITNIFNALILDLLLILVIDTVSKNKIDVHQALTIYSNSSLLVLLELSTAVFTSWILILLLISAHNKLKKYDKKELPSMQEIVFDE